jgi:pyruvate/2-oxoglutarate/acetoin dehydrogenase E1 component
MTRVLTYAEAVREATDQCMARDPRVYVMGAG